MKYFITTLFLFGILTLSWGDDIDKRNKAEETVKSVRVTYVANSGFIVDVGHEKIMFDGLFQNGMNRYLEPDKQTVELIKNGLYPFDQVSMVFISNFYADRFDPYLATQFMLNNDKAKLISPQQVINKMKIFTADYEKIKDRIIETTPVINNYDRLVVDGLEVLACHLKHEKPDNDHVENMAYVVNINGVKLFHSGDSDIHTLKDLRGVQINDLGIDIAFLNDIYAVGGAAKKTNRLIDARYNVLMHFEKFVTPHTLDAFADRTKLQPKPHIFKVRNEYQDFYINDFYLRDENEAMSFNLTQR